MSGCVIAFFYIFATCGILLALPIKDIGLIEGLPDTFRHLFGKLPVGQTIVVALVLMSLYTLIANMVTWTIGANRSAAEAANRGDLPAIFGKLHPTYQTPANSAILGGVIGSLVLFIYGFMAKNAEDLFWTTFSFSSVVFLLPYFLLFLSFLKLRRIDADRVRPYRVPGSYSFAVILCIVCMAFILQGIVFFIYTPEKFSPIYATGIIVGVVITVLIGEIFVRQLHMRKNKGETIHV